MIGVDTNVLVRYLVQDDEVQAAAASEVLDARTRDDPGYLTLVTLCELVWVLLRAYRFPRHSVAEVLEGLLASPEIAVENDGVAREATRQLWEGGDFADAVIAELSRRAGCTEVVTFGKTAGRVAGMRVLRQR